MRTSAPPAAPPASADCPVVAGLDVSAKTFDAALAGSAWAAVYERSSRGVEAFVAAVSSQADLQVVMEATGRYSSELAGWILERRPDARVAIVNPRRVRDYARSLGLRSKTDKIDARTIARFGLERRPAPWQPPTPAQAELGALSRTRQSLVEQRTATGNQLRDLPRSALGPEARLAVAGSLQAVADTLDEQIKALEGAADALLLREAQLSAQAALLDTIPGVGRVTAVGILAELGPLERFATRHRLEIFAGMSVVVRQSGTSLRRTAGLAKQGPGRARRLLYLSAMASLRTKEPNALSRHYRQLVGRGKTRRSALGAVMRKLLGIMRRVVASGLPYDDRKALPRT